MPSCQFPVSYTHLVGQSGSGKSTLVDLVPRYHDVSEGALLSDGKNVKEVSIHSLRSLIGLSLIHISSLQATAARCTSNEVSSKREVMTAVFVSL